MLYQMKFFSLAMILLQTISKVHLLHSVRSGTQICSNSAKLLKFKQIAFSTSSCLAKNIMRAIRQNEFGGPETMYLGEAEIPDPKPNQILVKVYGTAVNRADCLMCKGMYPGQKKDMKPEILGLEMSGIVQSIGSSSTKWAIGDRVMALLPQAGYSEYVAVNQYHLMPVPESLSLREAGGIPEVWLTAYQLLHLVASVKHGEYVLIHGGGSGVGTAATQLVKLAGGLPIVTAGSQKKIEACLGLGAIAGFNYKEGDFAPGVMKATNGKGAKIILDCVGGSFWKQNTQSLAFEGTWVNYGLLSGGNVDGNILGALLSKRARLLTSTLKSRSDEYKANLISEFAKNALPYFSKPAIVDGKEIKLKTVVDTEFPLDSITEAHKYILGNKSTGKVLIKVRDENES